MSTKTTTTTTSAATACSSTGRKDTEDKAMACSSTADNENTQMEEENMDMVIEQEIDGEADNREDTEAMACSLTADRENTEANPLQSFERELSDLPTELPEKSEKSSQTKVASENQRTQTDHIQCTSAVWKNKQKV